MPLGAFRINSIARFKVTAVAEVIRKKIGVTAVGNAQIDTAQSKFGISSALFDGSDSLNIDPSTLSFGTNDFTIEGFFRFNVLAADDVMLDCRNANDDPGRINIQFTSSTVLRFRIGTGSVINATHGMSTGTWYHIAVVRNNGTITIYIDGVNKGTVSSSVNITADNFILGNYFVGGTFGIDGHVDEFRVSNTARYTGAFTPPTEPFQNDENTLLLLHMDGTDASTFFEDDNGVRAKVGITATGNAQVDTAQSKFGGASLLVDGTNDKLQIAKEQLDFINGDEWTVEGWFRRTSGTGSFQQIFGAWSNTASNRSLFIGTDNDASDPEFVVYTYDSGGSINTSIDTSGVGFSISNNTWYHFAVVKDTSNLTLYINGDSKDSVSSTTYRTPIVDFTIGATHDDILEWAGNIDEIRVSNTARYTANFTPSTAPFVNDANTLLLLHMDGTDGSTDFVDDNGTGRSAVGVSAVGNAQVDTAQSVFGGASALFDGTGDYLLVSETADMNYGTNNFTAEAWIRLNATGITQVIWDQRPLGTNNLQPGLYINSSNKLAYFNGTSAVITGTTSLTTGVWYHAAVCRSSGSTKLFLDGTQEGSTYTDTNNYDSGDPCVGCNSKDRNQFFNGHIDEVRVSNTARYTANFTPATEPFQNDANTLLLLHMDGTDGSTDFVDDNGVTAT